MCTTWYETQKTLWEKLGTYPPTNVATQNLWGLKVKINQNTNTKPFLTILKMLYNYDDNQKQEPPMQANTPNHNNKPLGL